MDKMYPHISFTKSWKLSEETCFQLGQCQAIITAITNTPIRPDYRKELYHVALIKGAQATTAIEGNTLSIEEIEEIQKGKKLPPSREYLQIEVENIFEALNTIQSDVLTGNSISIISPGMIKNFHKMAGKNLGEHFESIPGKFRSNNVVVGRYKPPESKSVLELVETLCQWLKNEFHYEKGQSFQDAIIQAVVSHIYIAWIHPFSDGNGRTARLLEFYLLLRAGVPDIASHVLSNFYNLTRSEYYRQIENATQKKEITDFIAYAVQGFRDGLFQILYHIQENQLLITWKNYVYGIFDTMNGAGKTVQANKRRRDLLLQIPHERYLQPEEIINSKISLMKEYSAISERSLYRDLEELLELDLVDKTAKGYRAKVDILKKYMAVKL